MKVRSTLFLKGAALAQADLQGCRQDQPLGDRRGEIGTESLDELEPLPVDAGARLGANLDETADLLGGGRSTRNRGPQDGARDGEASDPMPQDGARDGEALDPMRGPSGGMAPTRGSHAP